MGAQRRSTDAMLTRVARGCRDRTREERGLTIVELLVAIVIGLVVAGGLMAWLITSIKQQNVVSSRSFAARQAQTGLEQLTRDLREAMSQDTAGNTYNVTVSNPTTSTTAIGFDIPGTNDAATPITWTCPSSGATSAGYCTRAIGGTTRSEIGGVKSATFSPLSSSGTALTLTATNPSYIGISLSVQVTSQLDSTQVGGAYAPTHTPAGASNLIVVQGGVDLRNAP
jgi:type IV pilus assembly protein PilW